MIKTQKIPVTLRKFSNQLTTFCKNLKLKRKLKTKEKTTISEVISKIRKRKKNSKQ